MLVNLLLNIFSFIMFGSVLIGEKKMGVKTWRTGFSIVFIVILIPMTVSNLYLIFN